MENLPHISVVIPTYNRPNDVKRALDSLAAIEYPSWDLTVVDQSDDGETRDIVETAGRTIPHIRYRHSEKKNCSDARNVGMLEAQSDIVAFLDDDCTVGPDWLTQSAGVLGRHPAASLVLGELRAANGAAEWSSEGFTPTRHFEVEFETRVGSSARDRLRIWPDLVGNGACMLVRRSRVRNVGLFDVQLGGGGRFPACEDGDYVYRVLTAGGSIVGAPSVCADHYGLRDYRSGAAARHLRNYTYATGAWLMKLARIGDACAIWWIFGEYRRFLAMIRPFDAIFRRGPAGLVPVISLTLGLLASFQLRIDRRRKVYSN